MGTAPCPFLFREVIMRKRRLLFAFLFAVALVAGLSSAWYLALPTPGVTEDNLERLRDGMSERKVAAILGGPGTFKGRDTNVFGDEFTVKEWREDALVVRGTFDKHGALLQAATVISDAPPYSPDEPYVKVLPTDRKTTLDAIRLWLHFRFCDLGCVRICLRFLASSAHIFRTL
jgi:hypothetical protein